MDCKENQPAHPKGNQSWIFIGRSDVEAETPILRPPDAGKDWRQEEKRMTEDEMVGWHHRLNGHGFEQTLGDSEGQRSLVCCSPWGHKELDLTKWLKNSNTPIINVFCVIMELQDTWNKITKFKERNRQFLNVLGYFNTFIWAVDRITRQNIS